MTTSTTTRVLRVWAVLVLSLMCPALWAQNTGTVVGRVTDASTKLALSGARVGVSGTALETFTTQAGDYVLLNVPAGSQVIEVNYVGYPMISLQVTIAPGTAVQADASFGAETVTELEKFVITGSKVGSARAINQQRAAPTFTNIVAADEIGRFPDQNAAESLQRIPGLALYRDQGEGRFIVVRGIRPDMNSLQINGVPVASPERGDRTIALDIIPSDALGAVSVTKVPTPDMWGDATGAVINMKTRSAFDSQERQLMVTAQGQYNELRDKYSSKFNALYADLFSNGKVGFTIAPSWQERILGSNNFEEGGDAWSLATDPATGAQYFFLNNLAFRQYEITRERSGINGSLEFKPSDSIYAYFRATYAKFNDQEYRYITFLPFNEGTITQLNATSATVTNMRRERHDVRLREKDQQLTAIVGGIEAKVGNWQFDGQLAYSKGEEDRPDELTVRFRKSAANSTWNYNFAQGTYSPVLTQSAGSNLSDPATFNQMSRLRAVNSPGEEEEYVFGGNARYDFTLASGTPVYVKTGLQARMKDKTQLGETVDYSQPAGYTYAALYEIQPNYPFFGGQRINAPRAGSMFFAARAGLTPTRLFAESETGDWNTTEDISAVYGMAGATFGKLNIIAGVRYEQTDFETSGNILTSASSVANITRSRDYGNFLPGVYLKYDLSKQTVLRAAWSNSLTRTAFDETSINRSVDDVKQVVKQGNPDLKAMESMNLDASIEHYLPSLGLISVGVFYKDIDNFTYERELTSSDPAQPGYTVVSFTNGSSGNISGIELAYQQQFGFLPKPFDGLGVAANYTWTDSEAEYYRTVTDIYEKDKFIGQSDDIGNFAITYEKRGFFIRAAINFRSPRLREDEPIGGRKELDRWVDDFKQIDVNASYKLTSHFELYVEALNLTDEPFRVYFGRNGTRFTQYEEYGWSANFGVRWKL